MKQKKRKGPLLFIVAWLFASKHKRKLLYLPVLFVIAVFTFTINDQETIVLYLNKLQSFSDHKIQKDQKSLVQDFYLNNNHREPLQVERHKIRDEFNVQKNKLKQAWEAQYKLSWPQAKITRKGSIADRNFEAHHVIPINFGGVNFWWNISPLTARNHRLLHDSLEEKACFSHDFFHRKFIRFVLRIKCGFFENFGTYINKRGTNYAKELQV